MGVDDPKQTSPGDEAPRPRRIPVRFTAEYSGRGVEGSGTVRNISHSGALIEQAEPLLIAGGDVRLRFSFFESSLPVEIRAKVVRETDQGFAVRFVELTPRITAVLKLAIARSLEDSDDEDSTLLRIK